MHVEWLQNACRIKMDGVNCGKMRGMCGVIGYAGEGAALSVMGGLAFLQHRGQDAAGIAVMDGRRVVVEKGFGVAEEALDVDKIGQWRGEFGIGHVRYSTAGSARASSEIQPFYVNQPFGVTLAHNGNLVNLPEVREWLEGEARRHVGSESDSEALVNVLAAALSELGRGRAFSPELLFEAVSETHRRVCGSYSVVALIAGHGLLAFRDPAGIRPLALGRRGEEWIVASENAAFRPLGFGDSEDVAPGEAVFVDGRRRLHRRQCAEATRRLPCLFEYIYLARPDSTLEGVSVYRARLNMGRRLGERIRREFGHLAIDSVVPVPDSGRVAALELARTLEVPYREALVKNRHSGRSFIAAEQAARVLAVTKKLNVVESEFCGKRVLLVDDSIVRGTTGRRLVALARAAGAARVYFASAAPPVRHPNVYGIAILSREELLAHGRDEAGIAEYLGADAVIYQTMEDLAAAVRQENPDLDAFEAGCFDGYYAVGGGGR